MQLGKRTWTYSFAQEGFSPTGVGCCEDLCPLGIMLSWSLFAISSLKINTKHNYKIEDTIFSLLGPPPPPLNCHQLLNNDTSGVVDSVVNSKKHLANCAKEEITKLKTEPLDATTAAMTSATQQPSFHVSN